MYLKQTNLENQLHISTGSPKENFNDNVFQHFVDELVMVFLCLCSLYVAVTLPFRMIFFHNIFCFISFLHEFATF